MASGYYLAGMVGLWTGVVDPDSDVLKVALVTSSYTPDLGVHDFFDDVTGEVVGTGYTAGGVTLASVTVTGTVANSWGTAWAVGTAYGVGKLVRPTTGNGFVYRCSVAGTSHASTEPAWPTVFGQTVADNGITWTCFGTSVVTFDAADASWPASTITARYAVIYKSTGVAGTSRLVYLADFGSNQSSAGATFQVTWDAQGIFHLGLS